MPTAGQDKCEFKNTQARWFAPFVGFFDLESLIVPIEGCQNSSKRAFTQAIEKHQPLSYCVVVLAQDMDEPYRYEIKQGPDCMKDFVKFLEQLAKDVHKERQKNREFNSAVPHPRDQLEKCWLCSGEFSEGESAVLDHCHYTGKFLGWAHNKCNLARNSVNFIPIFAHNLAN